jgi:hypothetical protein
MIPRTHMINTTDEIAMLLKEKAELLKILKALVLNDRHTYRDCHKAAVAAIAKAEGER